MHANQVYVPRTGYSSIPNSDHSSSLDTPAASSSTQRSYYDDSVMRKKRRVDRACDACRRKKTKCNGPKMPQNVCSNCIQSRKKCTYMEESKPRGPSKAYITALEDKVEQMDAILKMLQPEMDFYAELGPPIVRDSWKVDPSAHLPTKLHPDPVDKRRSLSHPASSAAGHPTSTSAGTHQKRDTSAKGTARELQADSDHLDSDEIIKSMQLLDLNSNEAAEMSTRPNPPLRYGGKSSGFFLLQKAQAAKKDYLDEMKLVEGGKFDKGWNPMDTERRPEFWEVPKWELEWDGLDDTTLIRGLRSALPPPDLCRELIDIWFQNVNIHSPLLHRPTFENQWQNNQQYNDVWFASLCLSIFAVASRWCDDPRVLPDNSFNLMAFDETNRRGAGRKYYEAALVTHQVRRTMVVQACLAEVQSHAAMAIYLRGTNEPSVTWLCISLGLRKAQDLGAHRAQMYIQPADIVEELWRRVYWILIVMDRLVSSALARPCCVRAMDCDLKLPTEVDDEYWDKNGKIPPIQPPGKPALITAFNHMVRLTNNIELLLNSILVVDTSKLRIGIPRGPKWKEEVVRRTNLDMAKWIDSLPHHLRWFPNMTNRVFSDQAATLYLSYYLMQLLIYRPFTKFTPVSTVRQHEEVPNFPFPASIICINAAKACARILSVQIRSGFWNITNLISASHLFAAILLEARNKSVKDTFRQTSQSERVKSQPISISDAISVFVGALEFASPRWDTAYTFLKRIKELLKSESMLSSTPQNLLEPAYPHLSAGLADRTIFQEPNNFPFMQSLPFALPEIPDPVDDWFAMPQSSMHVSASYPPQSHHYLDYSNQPTWPGQLCNDIAPLIYDNRPPHRPLNRTYSIDNFNLQSYPTVPVPVPPTGQMTSGWEPQALTMQTDRPAVPRNGYELPSQPIDIPRPMHGQTHDEQSLDWNAAGFHPGCDHLQFNGRFEHSSILLTSGPRDFPYSTAQ